MRSLLVLALAAGLLVSVGCSKKTPTSPTSPSQVSFAQGAVRLRMTDTPGVFDAVDLVVNEVAVHLDLPDSLAGAGGADSGWEVISHGTATYDLMTLRNGVFATIGEAPVPPGHYTQVRLKLGAGSNVVVDGVTYPLTVPSGMQSGYKLTGEFDVPATGLIELALDFDAARSIHRTGNGRYMLKPTCRVVPMLAVGAIAGRVVPDTVTTWVYTIAGADTVASTLPGADGAFVVTPLTAGTYTVAFHPLTVFRDTSIAGVVVTAQQTTSLGDVTLTPR